MLSTDATRCVFMQTKTITERELAMLTGNYDVIVLYRYRYRYFDICAAIRALDIHIALISKCNLIEKKNISQFQLLHIEIDSRLSTCR